MKAPIFDREKIQINVARIKKNGKTFEVVIDPDLAIEYRKGKDVDINNILKSKEIFYDAKKGLEASQHEMSEIFKTDDNLEIAKIILKQGEIQLTNEYRKKIIEEKKKRIIDTICRNAIDARTGLPIPPERIESAMQEAKVKIDEYKPAEQQVEKIIKSLRLIIPIKFETKKIQLKIPAQYASKTYSTIKSYSKIIKQEWLNDGSFTCQIEIPSGIEQEFFDKINKLTHGDIKSEIIK